MSEAHSNSSYLLPSKSAGDSARFVQRSAPSYAIRAIRHDQEVRSLTSPAANSVIQSARNKNKKKTGPKNAGPGQTPENEGGRVADRANHPDGRTAIKISQIASVYGPRLIIPVKCFQCIGIKDATLDTEVTASQVRSALAQQERMRKDAKKKREEESQVFPPVAIYPGSVPLTEDDEDDMAGLMQNMRLEERTEDKSLNGPGRAIVHYDSDY